MKFLLVLVVVFCCFTIGSATRIIELEKVSEFIESTNGNEKQITPENTEELVVGQIYKPKLKERKPKKTSDKFEEKDELSKYSGELNGQQLAKISMALAFVGFILLFSYYFSSNDTRLVNDNCLQVEEKLNIVRAAIEALNSNIRDHRQINLQDINNALDQTKSYLESLKRMKLNTVSWNDIILWGEKNVASVLLDGQKVLVKVLDDMRYIIQQWWDSIENHNIDEACIDHFGNAIADIQRTAKEIYREVFSSSIDNSIENSINRLNSVIHKFSIPTDRANMRYTLAQTMLLLHQNE